MHSALCANTPPCARPVLLGGLGALDQAVSRAVALDHGAGVRRLAVHCRGAYAFTPELALEHRFVLLAWGTTRRRPHRHPASNLGRTHQESATAPRLAAVHERARSQCRLSPTGRSGPRLRGETACHAPPGRRMPPVAEGLTPPATSDEEMQRNTAHVLSSRVDRGGCPPRPPYRSGRAELTASGSSPYVTQRWCACKSIEQPVLSGSDDGPEVGGIGPTASVRAAKRRRNQCRQSHRASRRNRPRRRPFPVTP